jgi:amino acid transporter
VRLDVFPGSAIRRDRDVGGWSRPFSEKPTPYLALAKKSAAAAAILVLTAINYRGVRQGGWVQSVLTGLTVGKIVALVALGIPTYFVWKHR